MKISENIKKVAEINDIFVEILPAEQVQIIKSSVFEKYIGRKKGIFLWENFINATVVNNKEGWKLIADFVGRKKCLMFFEDSEDNNMIVLENGKALYKLLYEMYGFEFYITNFETEFVICFNHHDCLIGCGTAKKWVETL